MAFRVEDSRPGLGGRALDFGHVRPGDPNERFFQTGHLEEEDSLIG
jgi:hypothetical protein